MDQDKIRVGYFLKAKVREMTYNKREGRRSKINERGDLMCPGCGLEEEVLS